MHATYLVGNAQVAKDCENTAAAAAASTHSSYPKYDAIYKLKQPIMASLVQPYAGVYRQPSNKNFINPRELVGSELSFITDNLSRLVESGHPVLNTVSRYYFSASGKHIRPLLVMLIAQATSIATKRSGKASMLVDSEDAQIDYSLIDRAVSRNIQSDLESQHVNQLIENATKDGHGGRPYSPH
ncbi:coq1 putative hexaprenyl diphosphate synthase, partial [Dipsacomyces acuminosporus]